MFAPASAGRRAYRATPATSICAVGNPLAIAFASQVSPDQLALRRRAPRPPRRGRPTIRPYPRRSPSGARRHGARTARPEPAEGRRRDGGLAIAARPDAFVFGQMANDTRRTRMQNGLMQLSALLPGLCPLQPLVLGRPLSNWHVPLTLSSTGAVRSRADGSGPLAATSAVAFGSA